MLHFEALYADALPATVTNSCRKISGEADLIEELAAYSPLIPDGKDLKVTFMLEFPDEAERKVRLNQLIGIKELISIQINGFDPVYPIANEDLARSNDEKTSAMHFLRFEFTDDMIAAAENGASWVLRSEHQNYQHSYDSLPAEVSNSLAYDFA